MTRPFMSLLVMVSLFSSAQVRNGQERKTGISSVLRNFPGYHLLTLKELDTDARAFFLQHFPKGNPSVVHADFDGDGNLDYALLLKNDKSEAAKLVILLCSQDRDCRSVSELDISGYSGSAFVRQAAKGSKVSQTESIETDSSSRVSLKFSGIRLTYFGQAEIVLYWNNKHKKIESITTAD